MPLDMNAMATEVVLIVKTALGPILERLAAAEAQLATIPAHERTIADLTQRLTIAETKAASVIPAPVTPPIDLTPLLARMAVTDAEVKRASAWEEAVQALRERAAALEATPAPQLPEPAPPVDITPLAERIARVEVDADHAKQTVGALRADLARLAAIEPVAPIVPAPIDIAPLLVKHAVTDTTLAQLVADLERATQEIDTLRDDMTRLKAVEPIARPTLPAPVDLTPLAERLTLAQADAGRGLGEAASARTELAAMRDRVVTLETKAAAPVVAPAVPVDIGPLLERIAIAETDIAHATAVAERAHDDIGNVRERVSAVETKAASIQPAAADGPDESLTDIRARVGLLEEVTKTLPVISERVAVLQTKAEQPQPAPLVVPAPDLAPLQQELAAVKLELVKTAGELGQRIAVAEVRPLLPGPAGKDGAPGAAGKDGRDGVDGVGFDDLKVDHDGERNFAFKFIRGERVKDAGTFTVPVQLYRGVFSDGRTYEPGDTVTWGGQLYVCRKTTTLKPDAAAIEAKGPNGHDFWQLAVKAGREGKPGRDGKDAEPLPIVKVGGK